MRGCVIGANYYYCRQNRAKIVFVKEPKLAGIARNIAVKHRFYYGCNTKWNCRKATNIKAPAKGRFGYVGPYIVAYNQYKEEANATAKPNKVSEMQGGHYGVYREDYKPTLALKGKGLPPCFIIGQYANRHNNYGKRCYHKV